MIAEIVDRVQLGDHVCAVIDTPDDLLAAATGTLRAALRDDDQVIVFTDSLLPVALRAGLEAQEIDVESATRSGQLKVVRARHAYLPRGRFDPEQMLTTVRSHITAAAAAGFRGLRLVGDMGWTLDAPPGVEHLARYEAQLNGIYMDAGALCVCLYHPQGIDRRLLENVICAHPATSSGPARDTAWTPLLQIRRTAKPYGLRLIGEADFSNRRAVAAALDALVHERPKGTDPVLVDISVLEFADAATAALLIGHAMNAAPEVRVLGTSGSVAMLMRTLGAAHVPNVEFQTAEVIA